MFESDPDLSIIVSHGTEVVLQVRRSAELKDVEGVVRLYIERYIGFCWGVLGCFSPGGDRAPEKRL